MNDLVIDLIDRSVFTVCITAIVCVLGPHVLKWLYDPKNDIL